ncbi:hypothetical protein GCM10011512_19460 [Tersicoccus solisilvae]|uniref:Uncharacterized protein n=1 Tax=Tersicoccus solisilvae TaxID=1882339 RepID=A0ABQ1PA80_9MICC|nr:hypothetical protein GCM10011512_19460 [Tersicoccus solisilvae]
MSVTTVTFTSGAKRIPSSLASRGAERGIDGPTGWTRVGRDGGRGWGTGGPQGSGQQRFTPPLTARDVVRIGTRWALPPSSVPVTSISV